MVSKIYLIYQKVRKVFSAYSYNIFGGGDVARLERVAAGYKIFMPENNHDLNFRRALFSVSVRDSKYFQINDDLIP